MGNWLMNHRTYDSQRYSPLEKINKGNVKSLKIAYAVAIGGTSANENLEATPLAEDGFLYLTNQWGVLYKVDGRSGDAEWRSDLDGERAGDVSLVSAAADIKVRTACGAGSGSE
jgi:alcohol dehydrogenase (cytochrome c)